MADKKNGKEFSRRDFLKTSGAVTGGFIGGSLLGGLVGFNLDNSDVENLDVVDQDVEADTVAPGEDTSLLEARVFFKRKEDFEILSASSEIIYPEDDNGPGSIALGVPIFIDKQLMTSWGINGLDYMTRPFQSGETALTRQKIFTSGIRRLNSYSEEEYDTAFIDLNEEQQIEVLLAFENDEVKMDYINTSTFFDLLRQSTIEGAFSDPIYGGNKNMDAWRMIEYPGAQLSYRNMMEEDSASDAEFVLIEPISLSSNS